VGSLVAHSDAVVHLAARPSVPRSLQDPGATHEANATGTLRVLEAAAEGTKPHVLVASSSSVYGANNRLPANEDLRPMPLSPYAASKLAAEAYALAFSQSYGVPILTFRFFNVFGPLQRPDHDYAAVVPAFVSAALSGSPLRIHGDGSQTRDFTFVGSVVGILLEALRRQTTAPGPVNLAFGGRTSVLGLAELIQGVLRRPLQLEHVEPRAGDVRHSQADTTRLRQLFPTLEPVKLTDGLRSTVEWMSTESSGPERAVLAG